MSEPFLSEIKIVSFNFPPRGWALCNGQLLPINQNQALFALLGTTYGGNGQTNFALPDLRGRAPVHRGNEISQGQRAGSETHSLSLGEMPQHSHPMFASSADAGGRDPANQVLGRALNLYADPVDLTPVRAGTVLATGGSQPHQNMQPYLVLNYIIALQGIFPSQN
jgi:microcystin-dependent protein